MEREGVGAQVAAAAAGIVVGRVGNTEPGEEELSSRGRGCSLFSAVAGLAELGTSMCGACEGGNDGGADGDAEEGG